MTSLIFAVACSLAALFFAYANIRWVMKKPDGSDEMRAISKAIKEGASAYFKRQYGAIAIVGIILLLVIWYALGNMTAIGFLMGAVLSGLAGYVGMYVIR